MRVLKFGGSSVANADRLRRVADIIGQQKGTSHGILVVVSAFGGVTDMLLDALNAAESNQDDFLSSANELFDRTDKICKDLLSDSAYQSTLNTMRAHEVELSNLLYGVSLIQEASNKIRDYIVSFGERISAYVLSAYLNDTGVKTSFIDARNYIKTDDNYGSARVLIKETYENISSAFSEYKNVAIITGFIGSDKSTGRTTTLGRGGSDYTAAIFAGAIQAEELQIWTDVNGVLSADPRKVKNAYTIEELSYKEALELSHFGAKVLYAPTVHPVRDKNIPVRIKNTFEPDNPGTLIHNNKKSSDETISGVTAIQDISLLTLEGAGLQGVMGVSSRLFKCLGEALVNIIMITQASSEHSITVAVMSSDTRVAEAVINKEFSFEIERNLIDSVHVEKGLSLIAIVGENMKNKPGVAGKLFQCLGNNGINIEAIAQGSSELNISFAVHTKDLSKSLNTIHDNFFLSEYRSVHLFIVGVGLVGSTLLQMIEENKDKIKQDHKIDLLVNGLSNSRRMVLSKDDIINGSSLVKKLESGTQASNMDEFLNFMYECNYPNTVFVDNTSGAKIPSYYLDILDKSIAISTPNKVALSSGMDIYKSLKSKAWEKNTSLNFETNVGAGLPVISTLHNMINSGDRVFKIEAVLSGSLSYIFNNYSSSNHFSKLVKKAQEQGFTEPDPRDDLSGTDARRKLIILARESGFDIEAEDINIISWLPDSVMQAESVDAFFDLLEAEDENMKQMVARAELANKHLRYIARFENGAGSIELTEVSESSPFFNLSGSDNMIAYYSQRYTDTPLIVRGPGAGAEVTAAGVLAEIININKS